MTTHLPMVSQLDTARVAATTCKSCDLHKGRTQIVFGRGNERADLMIVGEAPGRFEDETGVPFSGPSGRKIDKLLADAGFGRDDVYVCNTVKCRPPENRKPLPAELEACGDFLYRQVFSVRPRVIVALGETATQALTHMYGPFADVRGRWQHARWLNGPAVMPTYHPAYLLRKPAETEKVAMDLGEVAFRLGRWDLEGHRDVLPWAANAIATAAGTDAPEFPGRRHFRAWQFLGQDHGRCTVDALLWALRTAGIRAVGAGVGVGAGVTEEHDVKVTWHYGGGDRLVLISAGDRVCHALSPKEACGILHVVLGAPQGFDVLDKLRQMLRVRAKS